MEPGTLPPLVLASKSPTRQLILREMGFSFLCIPADIDEKAIGDRLRDKPEELVLEIGRANSKAVAAAAAAGGRGGGWRSAGTETVAFTAFAAGATTYILHAYTNT